MSDYRLRIDEIKGAEAVTSYTRWLASVKTIGRKIWGSTLHLVRTSNVFG